MSWNPDQYLKFAQPRLRPAIDLLNRVFLNAPRTIYDLGCGAGNVTAAIVERWPDAHVTGVDSSSLMLAQAARLLPQVQWKQQPLDEWRPQTPADLIYSNAAIQWLPDHHRLLPALVQALAPQGVLALQMPRNFAAPSHTLVAQLARSDRWRSKLESLLTPAPVAEPSIYYALLAPLARSVDIWESEYLQALSGADPVKEWTKGTFLIPYLDRLDCVERVEFELQYAGLLRDAYPPRADGITLFPFRRLFIVLQKA